MGYYCEWDREDFGFVEIQRAVGLKGDTTVLKLLEWHYTQLEKKHLREGINGNTYN